MSWIIEINNKTLAFAAKINEEAIQVIRERGKQSWNKKRTIKYVIYHFLKSQTKFYRTCLCYITESLFLRRENMENEVPFTAQAVPVGGYSHHDRWHSCIETGWEKCAACLINTYYLLRVMSTSNRNSLLISTPLL